MIEVLFGESEAASMKMAKAGKSVIGQESKKIHEIKMTGTVEGNQDEVICLGFMLDMGDIKEEVDSQYRREFIYSMFSQEPWGTADQQIDEELKKAADVYVRELHRLKEFLDQGEQVRVWYSDSPYSRCGFYFLCSWMRTYQNDLYVVRLPEYQKRQKITVSYQHWGEVDAEEFAEFLGLVKKLSSEERRMYEIIWYELREDNSPLRAVINGKVVGVPEDFYDFLIWKNLTSKPMKQARLIGDILGRYPIGVGDWWYARRINCFIEQGKIKIAEDSDNSYARMICL